MRILRGANVLILLLSLGYCSAQSDSSFTYSISPELAPVNKELNKEFPLKLIFKGEIVDYTVGLTCGTFCGSGTLKMTSSKKSQHFYLILPCFDQGDVTKLEEKFLNRKLKLPIRQFDQDRDTSCFFFNISNKFITDQPFYVVDNDKYDLGLSESWIQSHE